MDWIWDTLSSMTDAQKQIADKVHGVAAENRATQQRIADLLGIDRKSVNARMLGKVPFSGVELWQLSGGLNVDVVAFYPGPRLIPSPSSVASAAGDGDLPPFVPEEPGEPSTAADWADAQQFFEAPQGGVA